MTSGSDIAHCIEDVTLTKPRQSKSGAKRAPNSRELADALQALATESPAPAIPILRTRRKTIPYVLHDDDIHVRDAMTTDTPVKNTPRRRVTRHANEAMDATHTDDEHDEQDDDDKDDNDDDNTHTTRRRRNSAPNTHFTPTKNTPKPKTKKATEKSADKNALGNGAAEVDNNHTPTLTLTMIYFINIMTIIMIALIIMTNITIGIANIYNIGHSGESPCQKNNMTIISTTLTIMTNTTIEIIQAIANVHNIRHSGESPCQKNNMTILIMISSVILVNIIPLVKIVIPSVNDPRPNIQSNQTPTHQAKKRKVFGGYPKWKT